MKTKEEIDNYILKHKTCRGYNNYDCSGCFYKNNDGECNLYNERAKYKKCKFRDCENCSFNSKDIFCNYSYLVEKTKLDLIRKILK